VVGLSPSGSGDVIDLRSPLPKDLHHALGVAAGPDVPLADTDPLTSLGSTATIPELSLSSTLVFRVGASLYGCDIRDAQEIVPYRACTRLPGAPAHVCGLINVRGTIVTVIDLGVRLDPSREPIQDGTTC
jgi:hypothetical protein